MPRPFDHRLGAGRGPGRPGHASVRPGGLALVVTLTVGLAGCTPKVAPPAPPPLKVPVGHPVTKTIVEWDRFQGRVAAVDEVEIQAKISGYLRQVHFRDGEKVKAGQILFEIDQRPFKTELARANASLDTARARLREAEAQLQVAHVAKTEAESNLQLANANFDRVRQLRGTGGLSAEAIDIRENEVFQAKAGVASSEASIAAAQAAVETAKGEIATAEANLHTAEVQFAYTTIESPVDGRVSRRLVSPGDLIVGGGSGATLLTTVVSIDPIHVYFDADQSQYLRYTRLAESGNRPSSRSVHNPIYVALDDDEGFPHLGHMDFVDNRLDEETATIRGRAVMLNPDERFQPGLFVRLRLPGSAPKQAVLIPDSAITSDQSDRIVYVVGEGSKVEMRTITTGEMSHGLRIVASGLSSDDVVLLAGQTRVRPGDVIDPQMQEIPVEESDLPDEFSPLPEPEFVKRYGAQPGLTPPGSETPYDPAPPISVDPGPRSGDAPPSPTATSTAATANES